MMDRARRVSRFWDWLPAFRAVAETEHLPSAAEALHVSPSALSRAIRLLEEDIGQPLFDRPVRSIALNAMGVRFLAAVRDAMRGIHSALELVEQSQHVGPVTVSVPAHWAPLVVLPVLRTLSDDYPELIPRLTTIPVSRVSSALRQGEIDLAIVDAPVSTEQLSCDLLREYSLGVYATRRHPLIRKSTVRWSDLSDTRFVVVQDGLDVWPAHRSRRVALRVSDVRTAVDACVHAGFVAMLPDVVAEGHGLRRLPLSLRSAVKLFMLHRPTLSISGRTEVVADRLRQSRA